MTSQPGRGRGRGRGRAAQVRGVKQQTSPGGTRTVDFTFGGASRAEQKQAELLDGLLAAEEEDYRPADSPRRSPRITSSTGLDARPARLAERYGVDLMEGEGDSDFGSDDEGGPADAPVFDPLPAQPDPNRERTSPARAADFSFGPGFSEVAALTDTNAKLLHELDERKNQVRKLGVMLEALEPVPGVDAERVLDAMDNPNAQHDPRDAKIVQLAKKVHSMTANQEILAHKVKAEQRKVQEKDQELGRLRRELEDAMDRAAVVAARNADAQAKLDAAEVTPDGRESHAKAKASASTPPTRELVEARRRLAKAAEEAKKLRTALHKELGLEAGQPIPDKVLEEGWRGRAETIVLLKAKAKRLERQLEETTGRKNPKTAAQSVQHDVDRQAAADLASMEEERRRAMDQLTVEYDKLAQNQAQAKNKLEAAKARTTVLENENGKLRKQMKTLLAKFDTDNQLVDELRAQLHQTKLEHQRARMALIEAQGDGASRVHMVPGARSSGSSSSTLGSRSTQRLATQQQPLSPADPQHAMQQEIERLRRENRRQADLIARHEGTIAQLQRGAR